jgi:hypothetical protein
MATQDPAPAAEKAPGFDWKTWVAPIVAAAVISFASAWLGDHFAFSQVKAEFEAVSDKVEGMPPSNQIMPRSEIETNHQSYQQQLNELKVQLQRVEQKQDRIIELMLEESRFYQRNSRMSVSR